MPAADVNSGRDGAIEPALISLPPPDDSFLKPPEQRIEKLPMGMPCEINSLLKLKPAQGYPAILEVGARHRVQKDGYRIFPLDVPLCLVDENWLAHADIVIEKLTWEHRTTYLEFRIHRIYATPFAAK